MVKGPTTVTRPSASRPVGRNSRQWLSSQRSSPQGTQAMSETFPVVSTGGGRGPGSTGVGAGILLHAPPPQRVTCPRPQCRAGGGLCS